MTAGIAALLALLMQNGEKIDFDVIAQGKVKREKQLDARVERVRDAQSWEKLVERWRLIGMDDAKDHRLPEVDFRRTMLLAIASS